MTTTSRATPAIPTEDSTRVLPATARILPGVGLATPYVTVGDAARLIAYWENRRHRHNKIIAWVTSLLIVGGLIAIPVAVAHHQENQRQDRIGEMVRDMIDSDNTLDFTDLLGGD